MKTLLDYFNYSLLPSHLQVVSQNFYNLAHTLDKELPDGPEKTVCLRKLLESKDCAIRANLQ